MPAFNQFHRLFLWIHLLTFVQCTTQTCTLESFTSNTNLYDDKFETSNLQLSYEAGAVVRVPCIVGFRGFYKMTCSNQGWVPHPRGDKCKPIPCGHPGDVQFADFALIKGRDYVFGSQVQYTCHSGYQMASYTTTRNCLEGGWDGHLPVCEPVQCPSLTVDLNVMVIGDLEQPQSGSVVQFRCSSHNDELIGPPQIVCGDNGKWDHSNPPTCREITCTNPPLENFEVLGYKTEYKKDEVLRYRCNRGFKKSDGRPSMCQKWGQSAKWAPDPRCELITCKLSSKTITGTSYSPLGKTAFTINEKVTVSCTDKLWVKNKTLESAELRCLETGEWDFHPVCQIVKCDKVADNVYWWEPKWDRHTRSYLQTVDIDESVRYQCRRGYEETNPNRRATCTRQGWNPDPLCTEGSCLKPSYRNAYIYYHPQDKYRHEDYAYFKCTYDQREEFSVRCVLGEWTVPTRVCREKPCATPPSIENGWLHKSQLRVYEHDETLEFTCDGETDTFRVTCQSGEWKQQKTCQDSSCTKPNITNGELMDQTKDSYKHGDEVEIRCTTGSKESFITNCQSGEWTPKIQCPELGLCGSSEINNGFSIEHENKLYYTCNDPFKLHIKGWWGEASCVDGKWNKSECYAREDCGPVPHIPHMRKSSSRKTFHHRENFTILCETGHQVHQDVQALTCDNGTWTSNNVELHQICMPMETKCPTPPKIKNAVIAAPFEKEYLSNTTLTYKCREGFVIEGNAAIGETTVKCSGGTWVPPPETISCKEASTQ